MVSSAAGAVYRGSGAIATYRIGSDLTKKRPRALKTRPEPASAAASRTASTRRVSRRPDAERPVPLARALPEQLARLVPTAVLVGVSFALAWSLTGSIAARDWL